MRSLDQSQTSDLGAWREAYRTGLEPTPRGCPGEEALADLVTGEIAEVTRARVADHLVRCARCADDYRTLSTLHREAARPASGRRWWIPALAAAAALAAVALLLPWAPGERGGAEGARPSPLRGRPAVAVEPRDGAVLDAIPSRLTWSAQLAATGYVVRLYDASGARLWSASSTAPTIDLPDALPGTPGAAGEYYWTVEVQGTVVISKLGPYWFEVR
jgi:hypothetical protein